MRPSLKALEAYNPDVQVCVCVCVLVQPGLMALGIHK